MLLELISAVTGGLALMLFISAIPIAIFLTYRSEKKKDPEGMKEAEESFIQFTKEFFGKTNKK